MISLTNVLFVTFQFTKPYTLKDNAIPVSRQDKDSVLVDAPGETDKILERLSCNQRV